MTTEEFYARALLAALPIAFEEHRPSTTSGRMDIARTANEYAEALVDLFEARQDGNR
jgi:hypothetical protein